MSKLYYAAILGDSFFVIKHFHLESEGSLTADAQNALKALIAELPEDQAEEVKEKLSTGLYTPQIGLADDTRLANQKDASLMSKRRRLMEELEVADKEALDVALEGWLTAPFEDNNPYIDKQASWYLTPEYASYKDKTPLQILKEGGYEIPKFMMIGIYDDGNGDYVDDLSFFDKDKKDWAYKPEHEIFMSVRDNEPVNFYEAIRHIFVLYAVAEDVRLHGWEGSYLPIELSDDTIADFLFYN